MVRATQIFYLFINHISLCHSGVLAFSDLFYFINAHLYKKEEKYAISVGFHSAGLDGLFCADVEAKAA